MFRSAVTQLAGVMRGPLGFNAARTTVVNSVRASHGHAESDEDFDRRYEDYFNRKDIDGWEIRRGMNDVLGMDLIPDPKIIIAGLKAARRVNDYALAVRWLEGCKDKCGDKKAEIYPYLLNEIRPTLTELGVLTPEEMGYDQPELALKSVYDM
ncbi:cytochrome c oxidase subunit 5A, mitochondrial [Condylostylus longicornis]|uniref:cytochrome c oxidase subunit 5A, mitochondrial n=1 Tax=Condylostylus longicornis TaxID=2530218 RepID=UPI00244E32F9|nr:cytochrome c oxidase subunit 5A, mitochondrial [Condylostylus longicornis]